jgi:hypothetical protein
MSVKPKVPVKISLRRKGQDSAKSAETRPRLALSPVKMRRSKCPLQNDLTCVLQSQQSMLAAMRRLRGDLLLCQSCARNSAGNKASIGASSHAGNRARSRAGSPPSTPCPVMESFNAQVAQAIREISEEYKRA